jgi:LuxR family maltose regulon positive regulatory protein
MVQGLNNKEIGEALLSGTSAVKTHVCNIFSKLGVVNRVEAVRFAR